MRKLFCEVTALHLRPSKCRRVESCLHEGICLAILLSWASTYLPRPLFDHLFCPTLLFQAHLQWCLLLTFWIPRVFFGLEAHRLMLSRNFLVTTWQHVSEQSHQLILRHSWLYLWKNWSQVRHGQRWTSNQFGFELHASRDLCSWEASRVPRHCDWRSRSNSQGCGARFYEPAALWSLLLIFLISQRRPSHWVLVLELTCIRTLRKNFFLCDLVALDRAHVLTL